MDTGLYIAASISRNSRPDRQRRREQEFYDQYGRPVPGAAAFARFRATLRRRLAPPPARPAAPEVHPAE